MDTPPPVEAPEATSADLEKIFGKIEAPTVSKDVVGDTDVVDSSAPIPEPPKVPPPEAPKLPSDFVDKAEALAKRAIPELPARQKVPLKARSDSGVNYAAAFLMFSKGVPLKQIAVDFDITYSRLVERAHNEDWETLVKKHAGAIVAAPPKPENVQLALADAEKRMARVIDNREKNHSAAELLREDIVQVIQTYRAENQFLRPDDIATLAKALKITAEISMLSLGDEFLAGGGGDKGKGGGGSNMRPIIIQLPSAVSAGKEIRQVEQNDSEVSPEPGDEQNAPAILELSVIGARTAAREAVPAKSGKGHGVNFEALNEHTKDEVKDES